MLDLVIKSKKKNSVKSLLIESAAAEQEQDAMLEQQRKEREIRKKKEEDNNLTLEQTKDQVYNSCGILPPCKSSLKRVYRTDPGVSIELGGWFVGLCQKFVEQTTSKPVCIL